MKIKAVSAFKRKFVFVQTLVLVIFAFLLSCSSPCEEDTNNIRKCRNIAEEPSSNKFRNFVLLRDESGELILNDDGQYPSLQMLLIQKNGETIENLAHRYYVANDMPAIGAYAFQVEIERKKNPEIREELHKRMFRRTQGEDTVDFLPVNIYFSGEFNTNFRKIEVPFFIHQETDSSYILTSRLVRNNEIVAGYPIFFVDYTTTAVNPETFSEHKVILIPAAFEGTCFMSDPFGNWSDGFPLIGYVKAEINLTKYENASFVEGKISFNHPLLVTQYP